MVTAAGSARKRRWGRWTSRAHFALWLVLLAPLAHGQQKGATVYLAVEQAPKSVFPEADRFERKDFPVTPELSRRLKTLVAPAKPSIWEPFYMTFIARKENEVVGYAVICEEIGKHRPITFIVGVTPDGRVHDAAVMMYREPEGDQVRHKNFLEQFAGKTIENPILQHQDIRNVSGATLSVRAMTRGVRKALAVIQALYLEKNGG